MIKRILLALQFHTILPVRVNGGVSEKELASSATFFPLAGAFQGFLLAIFSLAFAKLFGPYVAGGLSLTVLISASGGFDLDGLADTADALAVKAKSSGNPPADRQKRLDIMKQGTVGAMGAIALIISILLKYLFISSMLGAGHNHLPAYSPGRKSIVFALLFLMPAFSKWTTIPAMYHGRPARQDGLGRIFIGNTGLKELALSTLLLAGLCFAAFYLPAFYLKSVSPLACAGFSLFLLCFFYALSVSEVKFFTKRFGGLTGDHLGALTELAEALFLLVATLWLGHFA